MREEGATDPQREEGEELEEGKEQERQLCNDQRRITREGGLTLKDKWTQGLKHPWQVWLLRQGSIHYRRGTNEEVFAGLTRAHLYSGPVG